MRSLLRDADPLVLGVATAALLGLLALAWWQRRHRSADVDADIRTVVLAAALGVIVVLTLTPRDVGEAREVLLVPFQSIIEALTGGGRVRAALVEPIENLLLFIPLGMALRWRFPALSVGRVTLVALAVSASIEVVQGLAAIGRTANVTDVIMNGLGGLTGALAAGWLGLSRRSES